MNVLVMNPGGNSVKVEVVSCSPAQQFTFEASKLVSLILEGFQAADPLSKALVVVSEEGLEMAHKCSQALAVVSGS